MITRKSGAESPFSILYAPIRTVDVMPPSLYIHYAKIAEYYYPSAINGGLAYLGYMGLQGAAAQLVAIGRSLPDKVLNVPGIDVEHVIPSASALDIMADVYERGLRLAGQSDVLRNEIIAHLQDAALTDYDSVDGDVGDISVVRRVRLPNEQCSSCAFSARRICYCRTRQSIES